MLHQTTKPLIDNPQPTSTSVPIDGRNYPRLSGEKAFCGRADTEKPTVGRIVHFITEVTGKHLAAVVIETFDTLVVDLHVHEAVNGRDFKVGSVTYDENRMRPGSWHWPERQ